MVKNPHDLALIDSLLCTPRHKRNPLDRARIEAWALSLCYADVSARRAQAERIGKFRQSLLRYPGQLWSGAEATLVIASYCDGEPWTADELMRREKSLKIRAWATDDEAPESETYLFLVQGAVIPNYRALAVAHERFLLGRRHRRPATAENRHRPWCVLCLGTDRLNPSEPESRITHCIPLYGRSDCLSPPCDGAPGTCPKVLPESHLARQLQDYDQVEFRARRTDHGTSTDSWIVEDAFMHYAQCCIARNRRDEKNPGHRTWRRALSRLQARLNLARTPEERSQVIRWFYMRRRKKLDNDPQQFGLQDAALRKQLATLIKDKQILLADTLEAIFAKVSPSAGKPRNRQHADEEVSSAAVMQVLSSPAHPLSPQQLMVIMLWSLSRTKDFWDEEPHAIESTTELTRIGDDLRRLCQNHERKALRHSDIATLLGISQEMSRKALCLARERLSPTGVKT